MQYLLGIDVGTTGTKCILFSQKGEIIGQTYCPYPTDHPAISYSEQQPADWWNSVCTTVKNVTANQEIRRNIAAISLSTQGGTTVGLDRSGKPVRPAMVWNDRRCTQELRQLRNEKPDLDLYSICGWRATEAAAMLQCRWLQKHEPDNFCKIHKFLSVPDYLSWKMTGKAVVDISNAGICRFTDIRLGKYQPELLEYAGLKEDQLAEIVPSAVKVDTLTQEAAMALDLPESTLLVSGAHDQYAVALGAGAFCDGDILIGSGTSWVVTSISDAPDFSSGYAQSVSAVPGKWGSLLSLSSGGICMEWLRKNITGLCDSQMLSYEVINREVQLRKAAEDGLFFFPFAGKASDKSVFQKASFVGLDLLHDRFHLAKAVMEGVVFQIVWTLENFRIERSSKGLILAGGASKSQVWSQILADIANIPVRIPDNPDLACVGAAMMAGVGCGMYSDYQTAYDSLCISERVILPDPERTVCYRELLQKYKQQAGALGKLYQL